MEETPELEARGPRQARDVMDQLPVNDYVSMSTKRDVQTTVELDSHALFLGINRSLIEVPFPNLKQIMWTTGH